MPPDLAISPIAPPAPRAGTPAPPDAPSRPNPAAERVLPNPSLRLEPELGLVVIEFRNDSGTIEASYPSERQLAAYRAHALEGGQAADSPRSPAAATDTTSPRSAPQPSSGSSASSADSASSR